LDLPRVLSGGTLKRSGITTLLSSRRKRSFDLFSFELMMASVNPYEPSQLRAIALPEVPESQEQLERQQQVLGANAAPIVAGTRYWLLGLGVHHGFAVAGYLLYVADWALGERTLFRHLGNAVLMIGIVISLFVQGAGHLQLCRWPATFAGRWWFRAAFVSFVGVMILAIGDLMLTLKYRANRDPLLWQVIEHERPALLVARHVVYLFLAVGLYQAGKMLQDRRIAHCALSAALGTLLLGGLEARFELLGSVTQVLREVTFLEPLEQVAVIAAWTMLTVSLVVVMFRLYVTARASSSTNIPVAIDDPLAD
jgi:hypothetical protein